MVVLGRYPDHLQDGAGIRRWRENEEWALKDLKGGDVSLATVAQRRSVALLSEFGLGHVREYAPFALILSA